MSELFLLLYKPVAIHAVIQSNNKTNFESANNQQRACSKNKMVEKVVDRKPHIDRVILLCFIT